MRSKAFVNHDLDVLHEYMHDWIDYLQEPDKLNGGDYTGLVVLLRRK